MAEADKRGVWQARGDTPGRCARGMVGAWASASVLAWVLALMSACAGPKYTVDDGRKVDESLLTQIRAYGDGERAVRPAIARSAELNDPDCSRQWELPFAVATSQSWSADERVAWVRGLGVDERLTVIAVAPASPLEVGERIVQVDGVRPDQDPERVSWLLVRARDFGRPFQIVTSAGRSVRIEPFEVCRGYARFVPPNTPRLQDYHWLLSLHSLEVPQAQPTPDEALWLVLWTQGLSEEGGLRMKAFDYGTRLVSTLYNLVTLATGLKGAALAADAAMKAAQAAATKVASDVLRQELIEQARNFAIQKLRESAADTADRLARQQVVSVMQRAATNRGDLTGVARVAATVFDRADAWALQRMQKLGANPLAGFTLHQKMVERGLAANAFALDAERLAALAKGADAQGLQDQVVAILQGLRPQEIEAALARMPLASAPKAFSYVEDSDVDTGPFSRGLIDALLEMPVQSGAAR